MYIIWEYIQVNDPSRWLIASDCPKKKTLSLNKHANDFNFSSQKCDIVSKVP